MSLYAATKKANELMAHTYSHLYGLPTTGLRFFTVYGPWGRPDMALFLFTRKILAGEPIEVFNHGKHTRDFTYIDDIVEGVIRTLDRVPAADPAFDPLHPTPASSSAPYRIYNIGNHQPVELVRYIEVLEAEARAQAPRRSCCRCSRATCRTPTPTSRSCSATTGYSPIDADRDRDRPVRRLVSRVLQVLAGYRRDTVLSKYSYVQSRVLRHLLHIAGR